MFEISICKEIRTLFIGKKLISSNQSGFKFGDSCVNQLLPITHEIYEYLDNGMEVRSVFLSVLKTFDTRVSYAK